MTLQMRKFLLTGHPNANTKIFQNKPAGIKMLIENPLVISFVTKIKICIIVNKSVLSGHCVSIFKCLVNIHFQIQIGTIE